MKKWNMVQVAITVVFCLFFSAGCTEKNYSCNDCGNEEVVPAENLPEEKEEAVVDFYLSSPEEGKIQIDELPMNDQGELTGLVSEKGQVLPMEKVFAFLWNNNCSLEYSRANYVDGQPVVLTIFESDGETIAQNDTGYISIVSIDGNVYAINKDRLKKTDENDSYINIVGDRITIGNGKMLCWWIK